MAPQRRKTKGATELPADPPIPNPEDPPNAAIPEVKEPAGGLLERIDLGTKEDLVAISEEDPDVEEEIPGEEEDTRNVS